MKKTIYAIAFVFALASCNNPQSSSNQSNDQGAQEQTQEVVTSSSLIDTHWKLAELNGKAIVLDSTFNSEPHLMFSEKDHRVTGNAGCNGFGGQLELEGQEGLKISNIAATQMACPNLELEQNFIEALRNVSNYKINGDTLVLNSAQGSPLAKLAKTTTM